MIVGGVAAVFFHVFYKTDILNNHKIPGIIPLTKFCFKAVAYWIGMLFREKSITVWLVPLNTGCKLNVLRCSVRLVKVLCIYNLWPVYRGCFYLEIEKIGTRNWKSHSKNKVQEQKLKKCSILKLKKCSNF